MTLDRRTFLTSTLAAAAASAELLSRPIRLPAADKNSDSNPLPIVDTHQHLWDLDKFQLPWLADAPEVLHKTYQTPEYQQATKGLNVVKAVYMEVDVRPDQQLQEAETISELCEAGMAPTVAAVVSGRPNSEEFASYIDRLKGNKYIKGIREVLHNPEKKAGFCLEPQYVKSIQLLGKLGMSFDLCMRPGELSDAARLIDRCPDTRFILDHCGNADVNAFTKTGEKSTHDPDQWKRDIEAVAKRKNVVCKISGIVAMAPKGSDLPALLAPPVNHCLDAFGSQRVMFGGDWPVCLLGSSYAEWVKALKAIVATRDRAFQQRLFHDNAVAFYKLA